MFKTRFLSWVVVVAVSGLLQACAVPRSDTDYPHIDFGDKLMRLGAGPEGGSFAPIGKVLCDTLNEARKASLVRCVPVASAGSIFNIHALAQGSIQLAIAQEDLVGQVYADARVKGGRELRAVALMHNSPIGIVVRKASGIQTLEQIRQGVINRGNRGSGIFANAEAVLNAMGLKDRDFKGVSYLPPLQLVKAFCAGEIDVVFNALAHPSEQYRQLVECGGEFLDIPLQIQQRMTALSPWLKPMQIPAGMYRADQGAVNTLGARNLLLSRAEVDSEAVLRVATLLRQQHAALRAQEPLLATMRKLTAQDVGGLAVPLHPGAQRALAHSAP